MLKYKLITTLFLINCFFVSTSQNKECAIQQCWIPNTSTILVVNYFKNEAGELTRDTIPLADLIAKDYNFNLPDSVVFYENNSCKSYYPNKIVEGYYELKKQRFTWYNGEPKGTNGIKTKQIAYKKANEVITCILNRDGIRVTRNEEGVPPRGRTLSYQMYPKN